MQEENWLQSKRTVCFVACRKGELFVGPSEIKAA